MSQHGALSTTAMLVGLSTFICFSGVALAQDAGDERAHSGVLTIRPRCKGGAMSAFGTKRTSRDRASMSAFGGKADIA